MPPLGGVAQLLYPNVPGSASTVPFTLRLIVVIASSIAPDACGRLYQCSAHVAVLIRHQTTAVRLVCDLLEKLPTSPVAQKSSPVLGEHSSIEAVLHQVHIQGPAVEQVVLQSWQKPSHCRSSTTK